MRLLPRRPTPKNAAATVAPDTVVPNPASKGRPTPKRRDAGPRRGPAAPAPKTRREAVARQRAQAKIERSGSTSAGDRRARLAGDPAALPRREAGPVRALARDYVDSRWMISNLLGLIVLLLLLSYMIKWIGLVVYAMLAIVLVEWMLSARRVLAMAAERGLDPGRDRMTTLGLYMGTRAYLPRRWRLPKARVARGAEI